MLSTTSNVTSFDFCISALFCLAYSLCTRKLKRLPDFLSCTVSIFSKLSTRLNYRYHFFPLHCCSKYIPLCLCALTYKHFAFNILTDINFEIRGFCCLSFQTQQLLLIQCNFPSAISTA